MIVLTDWVVEVSGFRRRLGEFTLDIPELKLSPGFVLGLLGRNGAGKSTTLGALLGLVRADQGDIRVLGLQLDRAAVEVRRRVGYVPEQAPFYEMLNADQTAALVAPFYPTWDQGLYRRYLERMELDPRKPVRAYSKGMRVKLALVLALAHRPELLVLDEPTAGLDPVVRQEIVAEIATIVSDGRHAAIVSSHITSELAIADYIGILEGGRLIEYDEREALSKRWRKIAGTITGPVPAAEFVQLRQDGSRFAGVTNRFSDEWLQRIAQSGIQVETSARLTLDEILAYSTGRAANGA